MDARLVVFVLGLLAAAAAPLASAQLAPGFYRASCPDAEKIVFGVIERKFKEDPGTAAVILRLFFHDCFANGCDGSILIDPLSNQSAEKEAGSNISVGGYDIIEEIKKELEKQCPNVVSCADILALSARDGVRLAGGPAYEVTTGRRDSLVSNREDGDNMPGPDIAVPKLMSDFSAKGFSTEEMIVLLAGGHTIGTVKCFFIETDAAPIDPEYKANISRQCEGQNQDKGTVKMDQITPNLVDANYFGLVLAKKMPLTIDRLMGLDPKTMPIIKAMSTKPADFIPMFAKAMEKLSVLKVITGKDGEIRRSCSEFNNPQPNNGPSVIRISSLLPGDSNEFSAGAAPGAKGSVAEARKVAGGGAEARKVNGGEAADKVTGVEGANTVTGQTAATSKATGGVEMNKATASKVIGAADTSKVAGNQAIGGEEIKKVAGGKAASKVPGGNEINKAAGNGAANRVPGAVEINKVAENQAANNVIGGEATDKVTGGVSNKAAKKEKGNIKPIENKVPTAEATNKVGAVPGAGGEEIKKVAGNEAPNKVTGSQAIKKVAAGEVASKGVGAEEMKKVPGNVQAINAAAGNVENNKVAGNEAPNKVTGSQAIKKVAAGEVASKGVGAEEMKKVPGNVQAIKKVAAGEVASKGVGAEEMKKVPGNVQAINAAAGNVENNKVAGNEAPNKVTGSQAIKKVAAGEVASKGVGAEEMKKVPGNVQAIKKVAAGEVASKGVGAEEMKKVPGNVQAINAAAGNVENNKVAGNAAPNKVESGVETKLAGGVEATNKAPGAGGEEVNKAPATEEIKKRQSPKLLRGVHHH